MINIKRAFRYRKNLILSIAIGCVSIFYVFFLYNSYITFYEQNEKNNEKELSEFNNKLIRFEQVINSLKEELLLGNPTISSNKLNTVLGLYLTDLEILSIEEIDNNHKIFKNILVEPSSIPEHLPHLSNKFFVFENKLYYFLIGEQENTKRRNYLLALKIHKYTSLNNSENYNFAFSQDYSIPRKGIRGEVILYFKKKNFQDYVSKFSKDHTEMILLGIILSIVILLFKNQIKSNSLLSENINLEFQISSYKASLNAIKDEYNKLFFQELSLEKDEANNDSYNLEKIIEITLNILSAEIATKNLNIVKDLHFNCCLSGNITSLILLFVNVIGISIKRSLKKEKIIIKAHKKHSLIQITIEDNGYFIESSTLSEIDAFNLSLDKIYTLASELNLDIKMQSKHPKGNSIDLKVKEVGTKKNTSKLKKDNVVSLYPTN